MRTCNQCNTKNDPDAKFCKECGSKLEPEARPNIDSRLSTLQLSAPRGLQEKMVASRAEIRGERRPVTILFTDIVGSTAIASELDPEDWREIVGEVHHLVSEAIYRYEGTITQLLGDGVLAFFGAPVAHEDDPMRAVHAALEIQESIQEYRKEIADLVDSFQMRTGINTGTVVIGDIGTDLHVEYLAFGDAVNIASRLEEAAAPGTVLVSEDTYKLVAHAFQTEDLGTIQVKGKDEPLRVFQAVAPRTRPSKPRGVEGLESPLVGREQEYQALLQALARLQAGEGGIATIVGEAGLGKSRLVAEIRKKASNMELTWVEGRCLSYGGTFPYRLWLDLLREFLGLKAEETPGDARNKLTQKIIELCPDRYKDFFPYLKLLFSLPLEEALQEWVLNQDADQLRSGTFEAIEAFLKGATKDRPLVLVCEDLHWADPTSIHLLENLLQLIKDCGLLFICVFRPTKDHSSLGLRELSLERYPGRTTDLQLAPLSNTESHELVNQLVGIEGIPEQLMDRVLNIAEGNPFYVEEILRSLINSGDLIQDERTHRWAASREIHQIAIPNTLHGVLLARIDRLQRDTKRVLQMASVIGRIFLYRVLEAIAKEEQELDGHLQELQEEEMIRERMRIPELEYIFKHQLTQEAAYNGLLKRQRRILHRQVAEALERLFPNRVDENLGLLAYHWEQAEDPAKAVYYLQRAGDQARGLYAYKEAEGYYQGALNFLREQEDQEQTAKTLMKLGLVYTAGFTPTKAQEAYQEAFSLWEPLRESRQTQKFQIPFEVFHLAAEEPITLDPGKAEDDISVFMVEQLFEGLVRVDPEENVLPAQASSWEVADEGTKYIFHLRQGLFWNDGSSITANNYEFAWKRNLDPVMESPTAHLLYPIRNARSFGEGQSQDPDEVGVKALDENTLEICLEAPTAYLPQLLAHPVAYPLQKGSVEALGEGRNVEHPMVSNGAYELTQWQLEKRMVLQRNLYYKGRIPGNIGKIECTFFPDYPSAMKAYATDSVDAVSMFNADPSMTAQAQSLHGDELVFIPRPIIFYLIFRVDQAPFDDLRVRIAFVHALDREAFIRDAFGTPRQPATGGFIPPGIPGHSPNIGLCFDPERANQLLDEAGYSDRKSFPEATLYHVLDPGGERIVSYLRSSWEKNLSIKLQTVGLEWENYIQKIDNDPGPMTLVGTSADYPDPDYLLRVTFHSSEGLNRIRWNNDRFDSLVEEAARVTNQAQRMELYREADRILVAEQAVILPLTYGQGRILLKPWITLPQSPPVSIRIKDFLLKRKEDRNSNS